MLYVYITVGFYNLGFGGGKWKKAVNWGKFNKMRRISEVSVSLSIFNYIPPYNTTKYINLHVLDEDFSEFDSCVLQISVFNACGQVTHLQEGRGRAGSF